MGLIAHPDFQAWLAHYAERHQRLYGNGPTPPAGICDGCGDPLGQPPSTTPFCIVCLAEQYGRDRAQAAARIAADLRRAIAREAGTPPSDVREAIEDVLEDLESVA
jgi:phenylpyruvate tautomerase PptA (4-oxalocrotonate tautomerase family)